MDSTCWKLERRAVTWSEVQHTGPCANSGPQVEARRDLKSSSVGCEGNGQVGVRGGDDDDGPVGVDRRKGKGAVVRSDLCYHRIHVRRTCRRAW